MSLGTLELTVAGAQVSVSYLHRPGPKPALLCLHGFGSTKEDYADLALRDDFERRELLCLDAPGFGQSRISDQEVLSIPTLVEVAQAACDALGVRSFHLLGHSMGGLTGLLLAQALSDRVLSFFDIEGNLAPVDCFLSRQIVDFPADTPEAFLEGFKTRVRARPEFSSALYVASLDVKAQATSVAPIFRSMVEISDTMPLLEIMGALPCPRAFVYGIQNRHLSYLEQLSGLGVEAIEIPHAGHFPMYSNPPALWSALSAFLAKHEATP